MAILFTLNLLMLVIGFVEKRKCPAQEKIPLYLIVAGETLADINEKKKIII